MQLKLIVNAKTQAHHLILQVCPSREATLSKWGELSWPYNSGICHTAAPYASPLNQYKQQLDIALHKHETKSFNQDKNYNKKVRDLYSEGEHCNQKMYIEHMKICSKVLDVTHKKLFAYL